MNKKFMIPLIIVAALFVIAIIIFSILALPKVKLGLLLKSFPDEINKFFESESPISKLLGAESHSSKGEISVESDYADVSVEFLTGYDNNTGDGSMEIKSEYGDMGLYLEDDEIGLALDSMDMGASLAIDTQNEFDFDKSVTLNDRLTNLPLNHQNDKEMQVYLDGLNTKLEDYAKLAIKTLPKETLSKEKENIDLFGEKKKIKYIEISMDTDAMIDFLEVILEEMDQDDELEELFIGLLEYIADKYDFDSDVFDPDDIDIEDVIEEALDNIDDLEADDFLLKIYYQGNTMLGFTAEYTDNWDDDIEFSFILAQKGGDKSLTMRSESYSKMELLYIKEGNNITLEYDDGDTQVEFYMEGNRKERDISGQFEIYGEKYDFDGTYQEESDGILIELDCDYFSVEYLFVEERKNKEYFTEITVDVEDVGDIKIDQVLVFGSEVDEPNMESWSNSNVFSYSKVIDGDLEYAYEDFEYALEELWNQPF